MSVRGQSAGGGTSGPATKHTGPALGRALHDSSCEDSGLPGIDGISCTFSPVLHSAKAPLQNEPGSRVNLQTR
jgi:hypothetical protein